MTIYTNTLAKKIVFDDSKRAEGVVAGSIGREFLLSAAKEVILSAGTFRSPQLLMASGVGPANTLNAHNISVIADRAGVGQNMWDHVLFGPSWRVNLITHSILSNNLTYPSAAVDSFNNNQSGILTSLGANYLGWEKLPQHLRAGLQDFTRGSLVEEFPADWPEIEFLYIDSWLGLQKDTLLGAPKDQNQYGTMAVAITAPFSRGNVTIASPDVNVRPIVNPNWLTDPRDMDLAIQAYRRAREFFSAPRLREILMGEEAFPGANYTTDEDLEALIRRSASTLHHACCTCRSYRTS